MSKVRNNRNIYNHIYFTYSGVKEMKYVEAEISYHKAVQLNDVNAYNNALIEINKAISLDPDNPDYHYTKAISLAGNEQYNEAIEEYDKAISINPKNPDYYVGKGVALDKTGKASEAIKTIDKAISLGPRNSGAYSVKAQILFSNGQHNETIKEFDKAISFDPKNPKYHEDKALFLRAMYEYDYAIIEYDTLISLYPKNPLYHNSKGNTIVERAASNDRKKYNEAIEEYDTALKLLRYRPEQKRSTPIYGAKAEVVAYVLFDKAVCLEKLGKIEDAINIYTSAKEIDQQRLDPVIRICNLYYNLGKYKEASEVMGELLTYDLDEIQERCERGNCGTADLINCLEMVIKSCQKINNKEDVDLYVNRLLELDPENKLARSLK